MKKYFSGSLVQIKKYSYQLKAMKNTFLFVISLFLNNSVDAQLKIGELLPNEYLSNNLDKKERLLDYTGKIILVDFWASWCAPCRKANKKLAELHQKYGSKNLKIVGISLDADRSNWLKAIAKDNIKYTQLTDPYGFEAKSALKFGVDALPSAYLFDTKGKLIAINPTEEEIKKQLNHIKQ